MFFRRSATTATESDTMTLEPREPMQVADSHAVLGTPLKGPFPDGMEQVIFGMGCFWGVERLFWELDGVYTTAAGYSGGTTVNPNYEETSSGVTGHAESVLVVYDPEKVSFEELLATFWENHRPTTPFRADGVGSQYRSAIFTTTPEQLEAAIASRDHYQARLKDRGYTKIHTEIHEADEFYYAEDYHQQYMHKNPRALCATGFCQVSYN